MSIVSDTYESRSAGVVLTQYINRGLELPRRNDTVIRKASNRVDFDYRHLRSPDNMPRYEAVSKVLEGEPAQFMVFSELVKVSSSTGSQSEVPRMTEVSESTTDEWMVVLITSSLIYFLDADCQWKDAHQLTEITRLVLVDDNPSVFAVVFRTGTRLVIDSYRRSEIVAYILSQKKDEYSALFVAVERIKSLGLLK